MKSTGHLSNTTHWRWIDGLSIFPIETKSRFVIRTGECLFWKYIREHLIQFFELERCGNWIPRKEFEFIEIMVSTAEKRTGESSVLEQYFHTPCFCSFIIGCFNERKQKSNLCMRKRSVCFLPCVNSCYVQLSLFLYPIVCILIVFIELGLESYYSRDAKERSYPFILFCLLCIIVDYMYLCPLKVL